MSRTNGWYGESYRHYLASKGVSTRKYSARRGSLLGSLRLYEDTVLGGATRDFLKDVSRAQTRRLSELEALPAREASYREELAAQPVLLRPLSVQEEQLAQEVTEQRLAQLQEVKQAEREARLAYLQEQRRGGISAAREKAAIRIQAAEQEGLKKAAVIQAKEALLEKQKELEKERTMSLQERARARLEMEEKLSKLRSSEKQFIVPSDWAGILERRNRDEYAILEPAERDFIRKVESTGDFNPFEHKAVLNAKQRIAVRSFAENLVKQGNLQRAEVSWINNVMGQPGRQSKFDPRSAISSYPDPQRRKQLDDYVQKETSEFQKLENRYLSRPI